MTTNADLIQDAGVISEKMGALHKAISEIKDLSFSETLKYHMMGKNITNEVLAAICETTTQTVSSWRNIKDDLSVKIGLALCLCNALRLHPEYSRDLISKANYNLYRQIPQNFPTPKQAFPLPKEGKVKKPDCTTPTKTTSNPGWQKGICPMIDFSIALFIDMVKKGIFLWGLY